MVLKVFLLSARHIATRIWHLVLTAVYLSRKFGEKGRNTDDQYGMLYPGQEPQ